jgi:hypothetical protein
VRVVLPVIVSDTVGVEVTDLLMVPVAVMTGVPVSAPVGDAWRDGSGMALDVALHAMRFVAGRWVATVASNANLAMRVRAAVCAASGVEASSTQLELEARRWRSPSCNSRELFASPLPPRLPCAAR